MKKTSDTNHGGRRQEFQTNREKLYLAFYKPYAVLTQFTKDENSAKETLAAFGFPKGVYPVGRLDFDSEGLLILSDDPSLNDALLNPRRKHGRTYLAQVENIPDPDAIHALQVGVVIQGQKTLPAKAKLISAEPALPPRAVPIRFRQNIPTAWIELTLVEGKNRQVRKMTAAVGHPTLRLVRISIGKLSLTDLQLAPGDWKELSDQEVYRLFD